MKNKPSIKFAIIATVLAINSIILGIFIAHNHFSYNSLATKQSEKLMSILYDQTELYFSRFVSDVSFFNEFLCDQITYNKYYLNDDLSQVEKYTYYITKKVIDRYPQISAVGYGDELGRFVAFRINPDKTTNLMLKDARTKNRLSIYSPNALNTHIITTYDNYSPQTRPFYVPVKENHITQWSDVYVNQDELMNLTISVSTPIFNKKEFMGVVSTDASLNNISDYLKNNNDLGNGIIYIVDKNNNILAHSCELDFTSASDESKNEYDLIPALNVDNPIIFTSMEKIINENLSNDKFSFTVNNKKYFGFVDELDEINNLGFRAIVTIPEDDLLSDVRMQQYKSLSTALIIIILSIVLTIWILSYIIRPLENVTDAAKALSDGDFSVVLKEDSLKFYETTELVNSFNNMSLELKHAFSTIKENETILESKVLAKTAELQKAYNELLEREKLASLGGLVAGISHEINTPLGVAVSASSYLQRQNDNLYETISNSGLSKEQFINYLEVASESVNIIDKNLTRAAELVNSFKQISVDQSTSVYIRFLLKEYFEMIFLTLKHEYKNKPFEYNINCHEELEIYSNPGAISQIFTNLIMNSLKHGFIENNVLSINIDVEKNEDEIVVYYRDNGRGIPAENIKHIFEPFFTTKRNEGGSGLGLSMVYNIVTANLGGSIVCESQFNKGVLFTIRIPNKFRKGV